MADLVKAVSDHHLNVTVVLVGVGDSVTEIISAHRSVERCIRQIHMPRMTNAELYEILEKAARITGLPFSERAARAIVSLARGFPHYVHLLASEAMKVAVLRRADEVSFNFLASSLDAALSRSFRSLSDAYVQAAQSPRRDAMHRHVLLSCALAATDEQGYFRPADLLGFVAHLLGRSQVSTNNFVTHLTEFSSEKRGGILKKIGTSRNYRYRFSNPLMIPYVLAKGLQSGLISPEDLGVDVPEHSAIP